MKKDIDKTMPDEKNLAKEFDKNMAKLEQWEELSEQGEQSEMINTSKDLSALKNIVEQSIDKNESEEAVAKINDFFEKWDEILKNDTEEEGELEFIKKNKRIIDAKQIKKLENRSIWVPDKIIESVGAVVWFIENWNWQKSTVAKVLLRIADWILNTEK